MPLLNRRSISGYARVGPDGDDLAPRILSPIPPENCPIWNRGHSSAWESSRPEYRPIINHQNPSQILPQTRKTSLSDITNSVDLQTRVVSQPCPGLRVREADSSHALPMQRRIRKGMRAVSFCLPISNKQALKIPQCDGATERGHPASLSSRSVKLVNEILQRPRTSSLQYDNLESVPPARSWSVSSAEHYWLAAPSTKVAKLRRKDMLSEESRHGSTLCKVKGKSTPFNLSKLSENPVRLPRASRPLNSTSGYPHLPDRFIPTPRYPGSARSVFEITKSVDRLTQREKVFRTIHVSPDPFRSSPVTDSSLRPASTSA